MQNLNTKFDKDDININNFDIKNSIIIFKRDVKILYYIKTM